MFGYFVKHLSVHLKYWSNFTGNEKFHAGNGKMVFDYLVTSCFSFAILGKGVIINAFNEVFFQCSYRFPLFGINQHPHFIKIDWELIVRF